MKHNFFGCLQKPYSSIQLWVSGLPRNLDQVTPVPGPSLQSLGIGLPEARQTSSAAAEPRRAPHKCGSPSKQQGRWWTEHTFGLALPANTVKGRQGDESSIDPTKNNIVFLNPRDVDYAMASLRFFVSWFFQPCPTGLLGAWSNRNRCGRSSKRTAIWALSDAWTTASSCPKAI